MRECIGPTSEFDCVCPTHKDVGTDPTSVWARTCLNKVCVCVCVCVCVLISASCVSV